MEVTATGKTLYLHPTLDGGIGMAAEVAHGLDGFSACQEKG